MDYCSKLILYHLAYSYSNMKILQLDIFSDFLIPFVIILQTFTSLEISIVLRKKHELNVFY